MPDRAVATANERHDLSLQRRLIYRGASHCLYDERAKQITNSVAPFSVGDDGDHAGILQKRRSVYWADVPRIVVLK